MRGLLPEGLYFSYPHGVACSSRSNPRATAQSRSVFVIRSPVMTLPSCLFAVSLR